MSGHTPGRKPSSGWYVGQDPAPIARPWTFDYDADYVGDPMTPVTTQASISGPNGELIVEEPGPEASWVELEHIVKCVNAHEALLEAAKEAEGVSRSPFHPPHDVRDEADAKLRRIGDLLRAAIRLAEGGEE